MSESDLMTTTPLTFLWLELTGKCTLNCVHCYADSSPAGGHGSMTTDDWKRVIDEASDLGVQTVQFIGGEPTLHPDLPELINHALFRALGVEVFTNLVHVTPQLWDTFAQPGVSLATSYYSDDPGQHAAITGRPSYPRTKANIVEAVRRGIPLRAGVVDLGDGQRAQQATDELTALGVEKVGYDRLRQIGRGVRDAQPGATQLCGRCADGAAAVSPDGAVWPCVFSQWMPIGDVRNQPLREIMSSLPAARTTLVKQGMVVRESDPCIPEGGCWPRWLTRARPVEVADPCIPKGGECWPYNCTPHR